MRLIDADALIDKAKKEWVWEKDEEGKTVPIIRYKDIINAPTVDAERHGHWFDEEVEEAGGIYTYTRCSMCGEYALCDSVGQIIKTSYCPYCGAKMDEVEE